MTSLEESERRFVPMFWAFMGAMGGIVAALGLLWGAADLWFSKTDHERRITALEAHGSSAVQSLQTEVHGVRELLVEKMDRIEDEHHAMFQLLGVTDPRIPRRGGAGP